MKSFYDWLMQFKESDTPVGDLAKDIEKDTQFPKEIDDLLELLDYINNFTTSEDVLNSVRMAVYEYNIEKMGFRKTTNETFNRYLCNNKFQKCTCDWCGQEFDLDYDDILVLFNLVLCDECVRENMYIGDDYKRLQDFFKGVNKNGK